MKYYKKYKYNYFMKTQRNSFNQVSNVNQWQIYINILENLDNASNCFGDKN